MILTEGLQQVLGACVMAIVIMWACKVVNWVWLRPRRLEKCLIQQGFSGNAYRLFYGDLNDNSRMLKEQASNPIPFSNGIAPRVIPFLHQSLQNYGKNFFMWVGPVPRLNIMEPELIREILTKFTTFHKPTLNPLTKYLVSGLPRHEGEKWARHRRIANPAFRLEKLKNMVPAFISSCGEMVSKWENMVSKSEGVCELDVQPFLHNLTADIISRTAFGSCFEEGHMIFELQKEQAQLAFRAMQSIYIPGWRFLPTKRNKRMKQIFKEVQNLLKGIVDKKLKAMKEGEGTVDDLLGMLLESNFKGNQQEVAQSNKGRRSKKKIMLNIMEVIEECKVFYLAGQETTAAWLSWTMVLLSVHQNWQSRAREEIVQVFGDNKPDWGGLSGLKVVTMILYEVLRLYPPAITLVRTINGDTTLGKLHLPAGLQLSVSSLLVHRDKALWGEDPNEFKPERFTKGISKAAKHPFSFIPFGSGPRSCIGQNFALIEAKITLAIILQRFSFDLSPAYVHAPFTVLTLQPQHGVHLILRKL